MYTIPHEKNFLKTKTMNCAAVAVFVFVLQFFKTKIYDDVNVKMYAIAYYML